MRARRSVVVLPLHVPLQVHSFPLWLVGVFFVSCSLFFFWPGETARRTVYHISMPCPPSPPAKKKQRTTAEKNAHGTLFTPKNHHRTARALTDFQASGSRVRAGADSLLCSERFRSRARTRTRRRFSKRRRTTTERRARLGLRRAGQGFARGGFRVCVASASEPRRVPAPAAGFQRTEEPQQNGARARFPQKRN